MGATLISSAGTIVSVSVGDDVGTTLGYESGVVRGKHDLGGAVAWRRIWATWIKAFLNVYPKVSGECYSVGDCRIINMSSAVCLRYSSEGTVGNGTVCGDQSIDRMPHNLDVVGI